MTTKEVERKELKELQSALFHAVQLRKALESAATTYARLPDGLGPTGIMIARKCMEPAPDLDVAAIDRLIGFLESLHETLNTPCAPVPSRS